MCFKLKFYLSLILSEHIQWDHAHQHVTICFQVFMLTVFEKKPSQNFDIENRYYQTIDELFFYKWQWDFLGPGEIDELQLKIFEESFLFVIMVMMCLGKALISKDTLQNYNATYCSAFFYFTAIQYLISKIKILLYQIEGVVNCLKMEQITLRHFSIMTFLCLVTVLKKSPWGLPCSRYRVFMFCAYSKTYSSQISRNS